MNNQIDNQKLIEYLANIKSKLDEIDRRVQNQEQRLNRIDGLSAADAELMAESHVLPENKNGFSAPPPPPPPAPGFVLAGDQASFSNVGKKPQEGDLEQKIGGKWFARIGITALILGVTFFLKYAFDNNWIGPTGRVIIGLIAGLGLLVAGEKYIKKYFGYGQIISGGGLAILYLSFFAAFDFYKLIDALPAFFFMIMVTTTGILLSLRYNALSLIILAVLGGFFTPFLISTGQNNALGLFSYILILDLAILVVSIFKKWRQLNIVALAGTVLVFISWGDRFYSEDQLGLTMFFLTAFFIVYSISSLIYNLVKKENSSGTEQALTLISGILYFASSYSLMRADYDPFMGFFTVILAVYYFLWAYLVRGITPQDNNLYNFLAFLSVGFLTLAIPIQFEKNAITIAWLVEAVALALLGIRTSSDVIKTFGLVVFFLCMLRIVFYDNFGYDLQTIAFVNKYFLTGMLGVATAYACAFLFRRTLSEDVQYKFVEARQVIAFFIIAANFLTIFTISREIVFHYDVQVKKITKQQDTVLEQYPNSPRNYQNNSEIRSQNHQKIEKLENRSSVTLSIFWLIYGIILMTVGIAGKYKLVRIGGLLLLAVAILKLFFHDLWELGTLYRIISSISLGVVLLAISFAYQKYKDALKQII